MKEQENSRGEQLRKALSYTKKNGYDPVDRAELEAHEARRVIRRPEELLALLDETEDEPERR